MLIEMYGEPRGPKTAQVRYSPATCTGIKKQAIKGSPAPKHSSTSYVERQNLTMRMGMRRFTRLTKGFSKKLENHLNMLSLYFVDYNLVRIHKSLKTAPAMAAGISSELRDTAWIVGLIDTRAPAPKKRGSYKKKVNSN